MRLLHVVLASNKGRFVLALLGLYLVWQVWLTLAAPGKIAPFPADRERVNVLATLPFPPSASTFSSSRAMVGCPERPATRSRSEGFEKSTCAQSPGIIGCGASSRCHREDNET